MKTIKLHGWLGEKYGEIFHLSISRPCEVFDALGCQLPGFTKDIADNCWEIYREDTPIECECMGELWTTMNNVQTLHIIPSIEGAKSGKSGVGKVILGTVLVASAFIIPGAQGLFASPLTTGAVMGTKAVGSITFGQIAMLGAAIALGGISQMLAPVPDAVEENESEKSRNSFSSAGNTTEEGGPVPLTYGRDWVGSKVIQASLKPEWVPRTEWFKGDTKKRITINAGRREFTIGANTHEVIGWRASLFHAGEGNTRPDQTVNQGMTTEIGSTKDSIYFMGDGSTSSCLGLYVERNMAVSTYTFHMLFNDWNSSPTFSRRPFGKGIIKIYDRTQSTVLYSASLLGVTPSDPSPLADDDGNVWTYIGEPDSFNVLAPQIDYYSFQLNFGVTPIFADGTKYIVEFEYDA